MQSLFRLRPIYKERPWGGHAIQRLGGHGDCPPRVRIGESWEISDRDGDQSVIVHGEYAGKTLRWLLDHHGFFVMGREWQTGRRFPLLIKILDAAERLSLQVHPPEDVARELGGEPKAEMWYLLDAEPRASLMAGFRAGVTREDFQEALRGGRADTVVHHIEARRGAAMDMPSGRIHAIGAGCLIFEVQQNSDTTYRVDDWGRLGPDGRPRKLHVEESLRCINFNDHEPSLVAPQSTHTADCRRSRKMFKNAILPGDINRLLVSNEHFTVVWHHERHDARTFHDMTCLDGAVVLHMIEGGMFITGDYGERERVEKGETVLLAATEHKIHPFESNAEFLIVLEK